VEEEEREKGKQKEQQQIGQPAHTNGFNLETMRACVRQVLRRLQLFANFHARPPNSPACLLALSKLG